jgi:hypothetical protein
MDTASQGVKGAQQKTKDTASQAQGQAKDTPKKKMPGPVSEAAPSETEADDVTNGVAEDAENAAEDAGDAAESTADGAGETAEGTAEGAEDEAESAVGGAQEEAEGAGDEAEGAGEEAEGAVEGAKSTAEGAGDEADGAAEGAVDEAEGAAKGAEGAAGDAAEGAEDDTAEAIPAGKVDEDGNVVDDDGKVIGKVDGDGKKLAGSVVDQEGDILDEEGNVLGKAAPIDDAKEGAEGAADDAKDKAGSATQGAETAMRGAQSDPTILDSKSPEDINAIPSFEGQLKVQENGEVKDATGKVIGTLVDGDAKELVDKQIKDVDIEGNLLGENGTIIGKIEVEDLDFSMLEGKKVNKAGKIVDENGDVFGELIEGEARKLVGKKCDPEGLIWNDSGKVIGKAKPYPKKDLEKNESAPFEDFVGAKVDKDGNVVFEGQVVGKVVEGEIKKLEGKEVDKDGDINDKNGNVIGHAERTEEEPEEEIDYSILEGKKINKVGNVVDEKGRVLGKVTEGNVKMMVGKTVAKEGKVWDDNGKVMGRCTPTPDSEKEQESDAPFYDFPDAVIEKDGKITHEGETIGRVIEGDPKKLAGKKVDPDGDIMDKNGNVVGKAERWEEPEPEPDPEVDNSALSGKRVNKMGNVVDEHGAIYGRVIEGDPKKLVGKMCNKKGEIFDEAGNVIGKAELVPDSERAGQKDGPFADFEGATVNKDGKVYYNDKVVGRVIQGDAKLLAGKHVDDDGEITDKNGNVIGRAERYEEEEPEKEKHPCAGLRVNKDGTCIGPDGEVRGKLTEGTLANCKGKEVDDDGDVVDGKGKVIGHVTRIEDVEEEPEPEPEKSQEEIDAEKKAEEDKELAKKLSMVIDQCLERIQPVLKNMDEALEKAERTPENERDEEKLVSQVQPLIEEGGRILSECNGAIRGLDPDGRIQSKAKAKAAGREATPEEYHLADQLKELTGNVTQAIDKAKRRLRDMPFAKKKLNPLWGLLQEPLFQILAAVGLLLSGVLGLVGKLLSGLGLGGLVNNLLGGLGLSDLLGNLGLDIGGMLGGGKKK